jgi:hypothetical protein
VRIGPYAGVLYEARRTADAGDVHLFIFRTTRGYLAAGCQSPTNASPGIARACDDAIAAIELVGAAPDPALPSRRYASQLNHVLAGLARVRSSAVGIRSRKTAVRERAARRLARAHNQAAAAVRRLPVQRQDAAANRSLAAALQGLGSAFSHVATAAHNNQRRAYEAARTQLSTGEAKVTAALAQLKLNGYPVASRQQQGSR